SPYTTLFRSLAAGELRHVDTTAARSVDGVVSVVTAADLPTALEIPVRLTVQNIALDDYLQPVLAGKRVCYVGEPVAAVVATDQYTAEDAAELVELDIAESQAAVTADDGATAAEFSLGFGDTDTAFTAAEHIVAVNFDVGRHSAVPMEPRTLLADADPATGALDIFGMTKVPAF